MTSELYHERSINSFQERRRKKRINNKIDYQLDWIKGIQEQILFANNPNVLPDYILYLKIAKRRLEPY